MTGTRQRKAMSLTKRKDAEFSLMIRERDGCCRRCGSLDYLQCCHVVSRSYHNTRWDEENAIAMCRSCHMWQTHHPIEGDEFFDSILGEGHVLKMRRRARGLA